MRRLVGSAVALLTLVASVTPASADLVTPVSTVPWTVPGSSLTSVTAVSCPAVGQCVALGTRRDANGAVGVLDTLSSGQWSSFVLASPVVPALPHALSCVSVDFCVAVPFGPTFVATTTPAVLTDVQGAWTLVAIPLPKGEHLGTLSYVWCAPRGSSFHGPTCLATGTASTATSPRTWVDGNASPLEAELLHGTWTSFVPTGLPHARIVALGSNDLSCGTTVCHALYKTLSATGSADDAVSISGSRWSGVALAHEQGTGTLSCSSDTRCLAGIGRDLWSSASGAWRIASTTSPTAFITSVSCVVASSCVVTADAASTKAISTVTSSGVVSDAPPFAMGTTYHPTAAACPSTVWCLVVITSLADADVPFVGPPSALVSAALPQSGAAGNEVTTGVSCASTAWCAAVGWFEGPDGSIASAAMIHAGSTWTTSVIPSTFYEQLTILAVSCTDPGSCVAVGREATPTATSAVVALYDEGVWSVTTDARANAFTGVSCVTGNVCLVIGGSEAFALVGGVLRDAGPFAPARVNGAPVLLASSSISCTSMTQCDILASGDAGTSPSTAVPITVVSTWNGTSWFTSTSNATTPVGPGEWCDVSGTCTSLTTGTTDPSATLSVATLEGTSITDATISLPSGVEVKDVGVLSCAISTCLAVALSSTAGATWVSSIVRVIGTTAEVIPLVAASGDAPVTLTGVSCATGASSCEVVGSVLSGALSVPVFVDVPTS